MTNPPTSYTTSWDTTSRVAARSDATCSGVQSFELMAETIPATLEQERHRLRTSGRSRRYMERRIVPPGRVRLGPCHNRGGA